MLLLSVSLTRQVRILITLKFNERDNFRTMARIEKRVMDGLETSAEEVANAIVADIRSNWSAGRQAIGSGTPPGMDTGNLDSSIRVEQQGRDEGGRFTGKDKAARYIHIDTSEGSNPGGRGNYSMALEDPDYYNLPFVAPALERSGDIMKISIKRNVQ